MNIRYDKEADAIYISFKPQLEDGESERAIEIEKDIYMDVDKNNKPLGLEILYVSHRLREKKEDMEGLCQLYEQIRKSA